MRKYKDYAVSFVLFASELVKDVSLLFEKEKAYFASAFFFFFFFFFFFCYSILPFCQCKWKKGYLVSAFSCQGKKISELQRLTADLLTVLK